MHPYFLLRPNFRAHLAPVRFGSYHFLCESGILQGHYQGFLSLKYALQVLNVEAKKKTM